MARDHYERSGYSEIHYLLQRLYEDRSWNPARMSWIKFKMKVIIETAAAELSQMVVPEGSKLVQTWKDELVNKLPETRSVRDMKQSH